MQKSLLDFKSDLARAIENLQAVVVAYDQGFASATISMAVSIRTLFHQTKRSTALLQQILSLNGSDLATLPMLSTKEPEVPGRLVIFGDCIVAMRIDQNGLQYIPLFDSQISRTVTFAEWWIEDVIRDVRNGYDNPVKYNRKDIIITHADQEGGAHFDPIKSNLHDLGSEQAAGWSYYDSEGKVASEEQNQKAATIRQISYETLRSLYISFPELFRKQIF